MDRDGAWAEVDAPGRTGEFPFRSEFSFRELIAYWQRLAASGDAVARLVCERVEATPALLEPIPHRNVVERHRDVVDLMMSAVFPRASWDEVFGAALVPFKLQSFCTTPALARLAIGEHGALQGRVNMDPSAHMSYRILAAYALVLQKFYGIELDLDYPMIVTLDDPGSGWERHFKVRFDSAFLGVDADGEPPVLDEATRQRLLANLSDPAVLMELLPPRHFVFRGFTVFNAFEVTDHEILSSIKRELIERASVVSADSYRRLEERLRAFFRRPGLYLGLAALQGDEVYLLSHNSDMDEGCIFADSAHYRRADFAGSIYERAVKRREPIFVEDLSRMPGRTAVEDNLLKMGAHSIVVAPLEYGDEVIGVLELSSGTVGDFNATQALRLGEVLPLFSLAVKRAMGELETRVQAVIKEKCTAIHPTVEWRFRRAVLGAVERRCEGADAAAIDIGPIVFENVHPLYALTDVRGSSTERTEAIQADLLAQLTLAREALRAAHGAHALPALDELAYRVDKHASRIETGLSTGDEPGVVAFLRTSVEPLFDRLAGFGAGVRERVEAYRAAVDPALGTVYHRRRQFDESLTRVTDTVGAYLELEQQVAQGMFPHYFEKQKTDGVDYQIYVGASLLEDGDYDPLYLRNLRLWQLMVTCGIAARVERLKGSLPRPLETAHLVLVQHAPLAIRFRFDEKRFDVDGAYNARYEIVKKRIDKAYVRGARERVTQPGRIAIVYGQAAEAHEYRDYIEYLQALGYLTRDVEDLALEDLQGVQGLRALRVGVDLANPRLERPITAADITAPR